MIIWRGFGWLVPAVVFVSLLLMQMSTNSIYGAGTYENNSWPKITAGIISAVIIAILGYYFNYKKRIVITNEETGRTEKSPAHSLFFIPIEFWSIILPLLFLWLENR